MSQFASVLKQIRITRGMTQEEFADYLGTSKQNISRYEAGLVTPKISTAERIAQKLGVTLTQLNNGLDATEPEASPTDDEIIPEDELMQIREDMRRNPELRTLHSMARNVTRGEIKQIEAFIRAIRTSNDYDETDTP